MFIALVGTEKKHIFYKDIGADKTSDSQVSPEDHFLTAEFCGSVRPQE